MSMKNSTSTCRTILRYVFERSKGWGVSIPCRLHQSTATSTIHQTLFGASPSVSRLRLLPVPAFTTSEAAESPVAGGAVAAAGHAQQTPSISRRAEPSLQASTQAIASCDAALRDLRANVADVRALCGVCARTASEPS